MNTYTDTKKIEKAKMEKIKIIFLIVFSCIALMSIIFTLYQVFFSTDIEHELKKYSYLSPNVIVANHYDTIINFQPLRELLQTTYEIKNPDYLVSIYFEYLPTGANITVNKDEKIWPASLIKIPVAMAAMKKVENGEWKFENQLVILDEDKDSEFGKLFNEPTGTLKTIDNLFYESLVNSDNTAHFVLLRNLESSELEDVFSHLGFIDELDALKRAPVESKTDNRMTAKNYSIFFRSLYHASYLSPDYSQKFFTYLKNTPKENLSLGFPEGTVFAHKTGIRTDERVWADSGIVYLDRRPFLLTVMIQQKNSQKIDPNPAQEIFKYIASEVYSYVEKAH